MADQAEKELRVMLNNETGKLEWSELERHFARGIVIKVAPGMDLVDVAVHIVRDDKDAVGKWMDEAKIVHASMDDAKDWVDRQPIFWAVVVAPWVLVQEVAEDAQ